VGVQDWKLSQDAPPLKGEDAYFGAACPTSASLLEEFGFVPSVNKVEGGPTVDASVWEEPAIVFHENEYNEFHQIFHDSSSIETDSTNARIALKEISNLLIRTELDQQLDQEAEYVLKQVPIKRSKLRQRPASEDNVHDTHAYEVRQTRSPDDVYTPRIVRGSGLAREGLCQICKPGVWLKIKQSAYWYHMNFIHGICANTGRPYNPPVETREKRCRTVMGLEVEQFEVRCGQCEKWIVLQKIPVLEKSEPANIEECNPQWWRHAQKCSSDMLKKVNCSKRRRKIG
jgi:hypothetical protein